jgi:hypothetical protein
VQISRCVQLHDPLVWQQGYHYRFTGRKRALHASKSCLPVVYLASTSMIDGDEGRKRCHLEPCVCTMPSDGDQGRFHELQGLGLRMVRFCRALPPDNLRGHPLKLCPCRIPRNAETMSLDWKQRGFIRECLCRAVIFLTKSSAS